MDSRHGELSRAMRNRCVEVCFLPQETDDYQGTIGPTYTCDSFLYRLRSAWNFEPQASIVQGALLKKSFEERLDHLSAQDLLYLQNISGVLMPYGLEPFKSIIDRYVSVIHENVSWKPLDNVKTEVALGRASLTILGMSQPLHPLSLIHI